MYYFTMLVTVVARVQHPVHTIIVMKTWDNQACESDVLCLAYCNILSPIIPTWIMFISRSNDAELYENTEWLLW